MSHQADGQTFLVPRCRRLTWDLLWFNRAVPQCGHDRIVNLSTLISARDESPTRISWPAIFLKAYALVAKEIPELRQTWYRWPWAHLYQHASSVGILTVQREHKGAPWLFWGRISQPEDLRLSEIQERIDRFRDAPPRQVFGDEIRMAALPTPLRRLIWGWNIHIAKAKRAKRLGTFFLSTLSSRGVEIQIPPAIQTGCLTYGPLDDNSSLRVTLAYDHRVMDGVRAAECLEQLELILLKTLREELLQRPPGRTNMPAAA